MHREIKLFLFIPTLIIRYYLFLLQYEKKTRFPKKKCYHS